MQKDIIDGTFREISEVALREAYLNDSDDVLFLTILLDLSNSVCQAGAFPVYNGLLPEMKRIICNNPEAKAKVKVAVVCYGGEIEEYCGFVPVYELYTGDICHDMGVTDTAAALKYAFDITRNEMDKNKAMGKRILRSLVFHVTDGLPTSDKEAMKEAIATYDAYASRNGQRRIQIIAATPDESVAKRLVYSDNTYLTEDYAGIGDAVATIAETASVLSSVPVSTNPISGELFFDTSEADRITRRDGIIEMIPRETSWSVDEILGL